MEAAARSITLHNFSDRICEQTVHFHVMGMQDGFFLWVGLSPSFGSLAVAMCSRFMTQCVINTLHHIFYTTTSVGHKKDSVPLSTLVLGDKSDPTSCSLAQRLAMKTKKQVYSSVNIPNNDGRLMLQIEKRIKEEMEAFPDKF